MLHKYCFIVLTDYDFADNNTHVITQLVLR